MTYRFMVYSFSFAVFFLSTLAFAQAPEPQNMAATCTFDDGRSLTVRYSNANTERKRDLQNGKVWSPGNVPMLLFTEVPVNVEGMELSVGAYSMYVVPDKSKWTLIVNRNITPGTEYDEKQDVARTTMGLGQLPMAADQPRVSFNHVAPKVCSLRVDFGKTGAWADAFTEK
jgi:Protein of unknown function (DUF2911)